MPCRCAEAITPSPWHEDHDDIGRGNLLCDSSINPSNGMPPAQGVLRQAGGRLWGADPGWRWLLSGLSDLTP